MSEKALSRNVVRNFPGMIHRVENRAAEGTPDTSYIVRQTASAGWMEFKIATINAKGKVTFKRFTIPQVNFLAGWCRHGGKAFLLTRIDYKKEYPHRSIYTLHCGSRYKLLSAARTGNVSEEEFIREALWSGQILNVVELAHKYL